MLSSVFAWCLKCPVMVAAVFYLPSILDCVRFWCVAAVSCGWLRLLSLDKLAAGFPPRCWLSPCAIVECLFQNGDSIKSPLPVILNPLSRFTELCLFIELSMILDNSVHCSWRQNPVPLSLNASKSVIILSAEAHLCCKCEDLQLVWYEIWFTSDIYNTTNELLK